MSAPYAVASMCMKTKDGVSFRMSVHVRAAVSEEEAIGQVVKHVQSTLDPDWHLAQVLAMPVYKSEEEDKP